MARCPLTEILRDGKQLGYYPPICVDQCGDKIEEAIKNREGYYVEEYSGSSVLENSNCSHPSVESRSQAIVRIGESAARHFVLVETCTKCWEEVQETSYTFTCSHEDS